LGAKIFILWEFRRKVDILSTHNLLRKFPTLCG